MKGVIRERVQDDRCFLALRNRENIEFIYVYGEGIRVADLDRKCSL